MNDVLSMAEIQSRFESEWVLIEDPETNEALEVQSGKVLYHNKDKTEFDRKVIEFRPKRFAVIYTGKMPEGMEFAL
jgi:phage pi2 protein 07